jgi:hypothetical protein
MYIFGNFRTVLILGLAIGLFGCGTDEKLTDRDPKVQILEEGWKFLPNREIFHTILALGAILSMGLCHIGHFLNRKSDIPALTFGLFCLFYSVRILTIDEMMIRTAFPEISYQTQVTLEYISFILAGPMFVGFLSYAFPFSYSRWIGRGFLIAAGLCSLFVLFTPVIIFADYVAVFQILIALNIPAVMVIWAIAIKKKKDGAFPSFLGGIVISASVANDIRICG